MEPIYKNWFRATVHMTQIAFYQSGALFPFTLPDRILLTLLKNYQTGH